MNEPEFKAMVVKAILATVAQGRGCINSGGTCLYEFGDLCCIAGHMMTSEQRTEANSIEGSVHALKNNNHSWALQLDSAQIQIVSDLQRSHDRAADVEMGTGRKFNPMFIAEVRQRIPNQEWIHTVLNTIEATS